MGEYLRSVEGKEDAKETETHNDDIGEEQLLLGN